LIIVNVSEEFSASIIRARIKPSLEKNDVAIGRGKKGDRILREPTLKICVGGFSW
jgi:hypothetical protein